MGCWNGTCLLSNLPIYVGDEVVFFVLRRKRTRLDSMETAHCYSDEFYEPLLYPVVGCYDDYGCIEDVKEDFSLIEDYFKDVELSLPEWDKNEGVFRNIERGYYEGYTFAMVHKDIYNSLIERAGSREEWWTKDKSLRDHAVECIEKCFEEYLKHKRLFGKDEFSFLYGAHDVIAGRGSDDFFITKYLETQDRILYNKLIEMHLMSVVLMHCRKFWFPQTGGGSQDDEIELYEVLADKMREKCEQRARYIAEWD